MLSLEISDLINLYHAGSMMQATTSCRLILALRCMVHCNVRDTVEAAL